LVGPNPEEGFFNINDTLIWILQQQGYAFPSLTGVTRQTISGFFLMGSDGGSARYSMFDCIDGVRIIDGTGTIQDIHRSDPRWHGIGISMGLMGVVSTVNISLTTPFYYIQGMQITSPIERTSMNFRKGTRINLFGNTNKNFPSVQDYYLHGPDYTRLLWFPQKRFHRLAEWRASRYHSTGGPLPTIKPFQLIPQGSNATIAYENLKTVYQTLDRNAADTRAYYINASRILNKVQPLGIQKFFDIYYDSLPMDNKVAYSIVSYSLSELFFPVHKAKMILRRLRTYYTTHGVSASVDDPVELYIHGGSNFWLSPSYGGAMFRFGMIWPNENVAPPPSYFQQFWTLLEPYGYRCHWAKYMPANFAGPRIHQLYPKFNQWLQLRAQLDPKQIFVSSYWRRIFAIPKP